MSVSSKSREYTKNLKVDNYEETDRISSLPDGVLSNILSLMPTKDAFRTSLLSTRWKSLWTYATTIDFYWYPVRAKKEAYSDVMDFVDRVLLLHNGTNINRFRLCWLGYCKPYRLNSWICTATKHNVRELDLHLTLGFVCELPTSLLTSINLVILKICGGVSIRFPMLELPSLKVLHLHILAPLDESSLNYVLSGCPILEELVIIRERRGNLETLFICSSTLKKLDLSVIPSLVINDHEPYGVVIKAPALEILRIKEKVTKPFHFDELPSLVKAELDVSVPEGSYKDDHFQLVDGLTKIPKVEQLQLSGRTLEVLVQASAYELLFLHNLTNLQIDICHPIQWANFPELLGHVPNLKVFILIKAKRVLQKCSWQATSQNRPKCLSLCLEKFVFRGFEASELERKLLRYFLENAMVLKKLSLTSWSRNERIKKQILKFPRGSSTCEIELRDEDDLLARRRSGF